MKTTTMNHPKSPIDLTYLHDMTGGDADVTRQMLELLIGELQEGPARLQAALQAGNWENLERQCHHFKSTLVYVGNQTLLDANARLWQMGLDRQGNIMQAERDVRLIQRESEVVLQALNRALEG